MKKLTCCLILSFFFLTAGAQKKPDTDFQSLIENLFSVQDEEVNYEELYEILFQHYTHPINLNNTTPEELGSLYLLTEQQIISLFHHLQINGKLLSFYELQAVPSFDLASILKILPFVKVEATELTLDNRRLWKRIIQEERLLIMRYERIMETKKGYLPAKDSLTPPYAGSPDKLYARFRTSHARDFSFGFTVEKDAGESLAWAPQHKQYGMDFYSFHALVENKGRIKKLALGDYQLQFGQGLVLGAGFSIGKGAETITTARRSNIGIRPYTSAIEAGFFRGVASTIHLAPLEVTAFYANNARDASLQPSTDSLQNEAYFSALQSSGFHRTASELANKGSIREQTTGINLLYKSKNGQSLIGLNLVNTQFNAPFKKMDRSYSRFEFSGNQNILASIYGESNWQNFNLFGEAGISQNGGKGLVGGFIANLSNHLASSIIIRHYDRHFHSFYGAAFGENSRTINEQGLYWGIKFSPLRKLFFTAYIDRFQFPWLKLGVNAPSAGSEFLFRANYQPKRNLLLYAQYRRETKGKNSPEADITKAVIDATKQNYLLNLDYAPERNFSLHSRIQWSDYSIANQFTRGIALIQDVSWGWRKFKLSGRYALVDTDDYENRQYVYEKDVLWAFSLPAYYGRGTRTYLLIQYKPTPNLGLYARWAQMHYRDRDKISSGNEQISGSKINQLKAEMVYRF